MKGITSTEAVHAGDVEVEPYDAVTTPIVQTSTYTYASSEEIVEHTAGHHPRERQEYGRYGNPTCRAVERAMAVLEGTADSALFASGMAAMATSILALTKHGSHVVFLQDAYRMTRVLVTTVLGRFGVHHTLVPSGDLRALRDAIL